MGRPAPVLAVLSTLAFVAGYVLLLHLAFPLAFRGMYLIWPLNAVQFAAYWMACGAVSVAVVPYRGARNAVWVAAGATLIVGLELFWLVPARSALVDTPGNIIGTFAGILASFGTGAAALTIWRILRRRRNG